MGLGMVKLAHAVMLYTTAPISIFSSLISNTKLHHERSSAASKYTWPPAPNQPFYIQTMMGLAIYNPYTGLFCPVYANTSAQAAQYPAPPQPIARTPAANASLQPSPLLLPCRQFHPPLPYHSPHSHQWRMRTNLRPQRVQFCVEY